MRVVRKSSDEAKTPSEAAERDPRPVGRAPGAGSADSSFAAIAAAVDQREGGRTHVQVPGNARPAVRPGRQEVEGEASCAASSNIFLGTAPTRIRFPMR